MAFRAAVRVLALELVPKLRIEGEALRERVRMLPPPEATVVDEVALPPSSASLDAPSAPFDANVRPRVRVRSEAAAANASSCARSSHRSPECTLSRPSRPSTTATPPPTRASRSRSRRWRGREERGGWRGRPCPRSCARPLGGASGAPRVSARPLCRGCQRAARSAPVSQRAAAAAAASSSSVGHSAAPTRSSGTATCQRGAPNRVSWPSELFRPPRPDHPTGLRTHQRLRTRRADN